MPTDSSHDGRGTPRAPHPTKILSIEEFADLREDLHDCTLVHCHGVFDLLHIGHIKHFKQARSFGDLLVVSITPDRFVNKGPGHPVFSENLRAEAIAALGCVDYVLINSWPTAIEVIQRIKPDVYVKGEEYSDRKNDLTGKIKDEIDAVESVGGEIRFTSDITFSSSSLINRYFPTYPPHVQKWLADFKFKYGLETIFDLLDRLGKLKVLVIGETILDAYCYCETMGKSGKEPVLAAKHLSEDLHTGGVLAIANHVAAFCKNVTVVSHLGEKLEHKEYIESRLHPHVRSHFLPKSGSPTLVKRRFIEQDLNHKMFEIYEMNDSPLSEKEEKRYLQILARAIPKADLVIIADYGHGIISSHIAKFLCDKAKFLVVNTQANAGNKGLNSVAKYPRSDLVTLTGRELAMELRTDKKLRESLPEFCQGIHASKILLTMGKDGLVTWSPKEGFADAPALAVNVTDRVGAGDTVLSIAALLEYTKSPKDVICFLGNVAGAESVATMGNSSFLNKSNLKKHISHILK